MAHVALLVLDKHELHHLPQPLHPPRPLLELADYRRQRDDVVSAYELRVIAQDALLDLEDLALECGEVDGVDGYGNGAADGRGVRVGDLGGVADELDVDVAEVGGRG